jgi:LDH2 family malate/lactate/ureidoglycolate dehydrogenase
MPVIAGQKIESLLIEIFEAAGTPGDIARSVAASLTQASLKGVDSHGIMRVSLYVDQIISGDIKPSARPQIQKETASMAVVSGNWGFGICALEYAVELAIQKAKVQQVSIVGLVDCTHTGRLGQFAENAAKRNVLTIITGGGRRKGAGVSVAPFGGTKPAFATNPYALGMPGGRFGPVVADFATSAVAEGKLQVYRQKQQQLPEGWIVDKNGDPSTDVEDFYGGGMLLPAAGHKGYSLALASEFMTAFLLGEPQHPSFWLHWCVVAIDVTAFRPIQAYAQAAESFLQGLKSIPPAAGFESVLLPGEPEAQTEKKRRAEGIPIPEQTWERIKKTARQVKVEVSV